MGVSMKSGEKVAAETTNLFDRKYDSWLPGNLVVPVDISREQLEAAARLVSDWQESEEPFAMPLVLEIYECLIGGKAVS
jgi:hypothetical protein